MGNGYSRLHIKKLLPDGIEINAFGDNPAEVIAMICETVALAEGNVPEPPPSKAAHSARLSHEAQTAAHNPAPGTPTPFCAGCQSDEAVELISFKSEGKTLSRYKCKGCNKWVGPKV